MGKRKIKMGRRIARVLDIPEETLTCEVKVTLYHNNAVKIENHKGIFECTDRRIKVKLNKELLCIEGEGLVIMDFGDQRIYISGNIDAVSYEK